MLPNLSNVYFSYATEINFLRSLWRPRLEDLRPRSRPRSMEVLWSEKIPRPRLWCHHCFKPCELQCWWKPRNEVENVCIYKF